MLSFVSALLLGAGLSAAQTTLPITELVGTWSSKSNSTMTGSGFYDPSKEEFTEPAHPGISYAFSEDNHFEEAYYRAVANPGQPDCPKGIMQFQHGSFQKYDNGSLVLIPIAVDGRQLYSDPCSYKNSIYTRYNTTEVFKKYEILTDPYHNIKRLNLYKYDGSPMMPLYLAMTSANMLPTSTLNPLTTSTAGGAKATAKVKRSQLPANHMLDKRSPEMRRADTVWWLGVVLTASGGAMWWFF